MGTLSVRLDVKKKRTLSQHANTISMYDSHDTLIQHDYMNIGSRCYGRLLVLAAASQISSFVSLLVASKCITTHDTVAIKTYQ